MYKDRRKRSERAGIGDTKGDGNVDRGVCEVLRVVKLSIGNNLGNVVLSTSAVERDRSRDWKIGSIEGVADWERMSNCGPRMSRIVLTVEDGS